MRLLILFLFVAFVVGGTSLGRRLQRRPSVVMLGCALMGSMYLSYRVVR
jgi:hypothetical protein